MAAYQPVGAPVTIQQLQVGSVYAPLLNPLGIRGVHIGTLFTVTRRLAQRAVAVTLVGGLGGLLTILAGDYPPNMLFQRHMTAAEIAAIEEAEADRLAGLRMEQQMLGKVAASIQGPSGVGFPGGSPGPVVKLISRFIGRQGGGRRKTKKRRGTRRNRKGTNHH